MTRTRQALVVLLCLSAVIRIAYFVRLLDTDFIVIPLLDAQAYHDWATDLVNGDWGWNDTYWMGPLYPHLVALIYVAFGVGSPAPLAFQLALSLLNIWLLHRLALALLKERGDAEPIALLAATLYALYGAPVFYAGYLLMATLVTTLFLWIALQAVRAVERPVVREWFVLGLLVGLCGLGRGNVLILLPLLPILLWKVVPKPAVGRARLVAVFLLGGVLMLAPATLRNILVAKDFVLLTSNGGVNLLIGQQAAYKGIFAPVKGEAEAQAEFDPSMEATLERELGRDLKGSEVSRILAHDAWQTFKDDLALMPMHYVRKAYRFWNGYELPQIISYDFWKKEHWPLRILPMPFVLLSALGLLGWFFLPRPARWIWLLMVGGYFLSLLPFFPTSRYRQPVAPLLALTTALYLWNLRSNPQLIRRWLPAGLLMILALWPRWARMAPEAVDWQVRLHQASRASRRGNMEHTLLYGRLAEEARPGYADTPFHLSLYLEDLHAREEALAALRIASSRAPTNRLIYYRIGRTYEEMGKYDDALTAYEKASELAPDWHYPWMRVGLIFRERGEQERALEAMETAYRLGPGSQKVRSNLASMVAETGDLPRALELLESVTRDYPHYVPGWFNLALASWQAGRIDEARRALERAAAVHGITQDQMDQIDQLRRMMDASPHT